MRRRPIPQNSPLVLLTVAILISICNCRQQQEAAEAPPPPLCDFGPSMQLQMAIQHLAVLGYVPASKIEKQDYHYHEHLITIQNQQFFIVDVKQHWFLSRSEEYTGAIEHGVLGTVKNAWAYFVTSDTDEPTKPDAIIEEWEFETQEEAFDAFKEVGNLLSSKYIKEPSYSLQHDDRIYLLYTRAHTFQKDLDRIYEILKSHL